MEWNLEGLTVAGLYMDMFPVKGRVEYSRVKYGGGVQHMVVLNTTVEIFKQTLDRILLDHENITQVWSR